MIKKVKIYLVLLLSLMFAVSCFAVITSSHKAQATTNSSFYIEGASFRIPNGTENFGIRFKARLDATTYQNVKGSATFGFEIVPYDLSNDVDEIKKITGLTPELEDGEYVFTGAVYDILWHNITRPFTARAYYRIGDAEPVYTNGGEWFDSRTLFTMSTQVLVDSNPEYASYEDKFYEIINYALEKGYVENELRIDSKSKHIEVGDTFTVSSSVKNSDKQDRVLNAYPQISVFDENGEELSNVIELITGSQDTYKVVGLASNVTIKAQLGSGTSKIVEAFEGYNFVSETFGNIETESSVISGVYGKGAATTIKGGEISSVTLAKTSADNIYNTKSDVNAYIGQSGFEVGKTLSIEFTGKNLPMIGLFLDGAPEGTVIGGIADSGTGIIFSNWANGDGRFYYYGPNRMFSNNSTSAVYNNVKYDNAPWAYDKLVNGTEYRLDVSLVSIDTETNQANINFEFYTKIEGEWVASGSKTFTTYANNSGTNYAKTPLNLTSTKFALYGAPRNPYGELTFSYKIYDTPQA